MKKKEKNSNVYNLTEKEFIVLKLLVKGLSNNEISKTLNISCHTSKAHVGNIMYKMNTKNRIKAAIKAIKEELV